MTERNDLPPAPYLPTDRPDTFESTIISRSGWYGDGQHGGVVSALLGHAIESTPTLAPMEVARLTVELFRVVPVTTLRVETQVVREGKKIQVVEASLFDSSGLELARAVGVRIRTVGLDIPAEARTPPIDLPRPEHSTSPVLDMWGIGRPGEILYHRTAVEVREIANGFDSIGPGAMWMRIARPLVAGHEVTPLTRAVVVGDFVNGLSRLADPDRFVFMNADLTTHLHRLPRGDWVGVEALSRWDDYGRGVATGRLFDLEGEIGRSTQTLFLDPV